MRPTNYFKVRAGDVEQTFAFETWDRGAIRAAFNRATTFADARRGRLSVFYPVPLSGPWDPIPSIVTAEAPLPVWRSPRAVSPPVPVCSFAESWCF